MSGDSGEGFCASCKRYTKNCICNYCQNCAYENHMGPCTHGINNSVFDSMTQNKSIRELQTSLPWTTHYHHDFRASPLSHKDFGHALLHIQKAIGKLAAVINDAEHGGSEFTKEEVDPYIADLVICALRMANTCPGRTIDLEQAVIERIEKKNNIKL